jgi:la-related protein 1
MHFFSISFFALFVCFSVFIHLHLAALCFLVYVAPSEYYFSTDNLCKDLFLRGHMDANGFVPISLLLSFNRVRALTSDQATIVKALQDSEKVEVSGGRLRRRGDWEYWVLKEPSGATAATGAGNATAFSSASSPPQQQQNSASGTSGGQVNTSHDGGAWRTDDNDSEWKVAERKHGGSKHHRHQHHRKHSGQEEEQEEQEDAPDPLFQFDEDLVEEPKLDFSDALNGEEEEEDSAHDEQQLKASELDDEDIDDLLIIVDSPARPSRSPRISNGAAAGSTDPTKKEGRRYVEPFSRKTMTDDVISAINDGLYFYEQDLFMGRMRCTTSDPKLQLVASPDSADAADALSRAGENAAGSWNMPDFRTMSTSPDVYAGDRCASVGAGAGAGSGSGPLQGSGTGAHSGQRGAPPTTPVSKLKQMATPGLSSPQRLYPVKEKKRSRRRRNTASAQPLELTGTSAPGSTQGLSPRSAGASALASSPEANSYNVGWVMAPGRSHRQRSTSGASPSSYGSPSSFTRTDLPKFSHPSHSLLHDTGFTQTKYKKYRTACLKERRQLGFGRSREMNTLFRFWSHFLRDQFNR